MSIPLASAKDFSWSSSKSYDKFFGSPYNPVLLMSVIFCPAIHCFTAFWALLETLVSILANILEAFSAEAPKSSNACLAAIVDAICSLVYV
ncbi:MAG: hypothetical protein IKQ33_06830 [Clostridia bacterium]|nr:hypothetical protein [Clostridia bacterium]